MYAVGTDTRVCEVVGGIVQGVGFPPFVYKLAAGHSLGGYVRNNNGSGFEPVDPPDGICRCEAT
jgi:hypothetical protein